MRRYVEILVVLVGLGVPLIVGMAASSQSGTSRQRLATAPFVEANVIYVHPSARSCEWRHGHASVRCTLTNGWTCTIEIEHQTGVCLTHTTVSSEPLLG